MNQLTLSIIFYLFAAITVLSAAFVVFSKNIIYSAFSLLFTFFGVAALYVFLSADFIAVTQVVVYVGLHDRVGEHHTEKQEHQVVVYVGGILVLLLFGVMFTNTIMQADLKTDVLHVVPGTILLLGMIGGMLYTFYTTGDWMPGETQLQGSVVQRVGFETMSRFMLPFEMASIVLLVALLGAAFLARYDKAHKNEH